jgi:hypothetical protein
MLLWTAQGDDPNGASGQASFDRGLLGQPSSADDWRLDAYAW